MQRNSKSTGTDKINEQRYFQIVDKEEMAATFEGSQRIPEKIRNSLQ